MPKVCKLCGEFEENHHEPAWLEIPDGCCCDWAEWDIVKLTELPPVCESFVDVGGLCCDRCEHDKACHK